MEKPGATISLRGVRKAFGERVVFENLDLDVKAGEFVVLVGPSGCGKSTLLRLIAGLETPQSGRVETSARGRTAFVFQEPQLLPWRRVVDNVRLPLELQKVPAPERGARAQEALTRVRLPGEGERFPSELSGGMKMRVSLARALVSRPTLLLLDEPFAALDELSRFELEEELHGLCRGSGQTTVMVTHSFSSAVFLADRILLLSVAARGVGDTLSVTEMQRGAAWRTRPEYAQAVAQCRRRFEGLGK